MTWYCYYDDTGRLVSQGSLDTPAPDGLTRLELPAKPPDSQMWDESTRSFVPRPAKVLVDRLQDLADDPELVAVWQQLTVAQRQVLRDRLGRLLGQYRYRNEAQPQDLIDG